MYPAVQQSRVDATLAQVSQQQWRAVFLGIFLSLFGVIYLQRIGYVTSPGALETTQAPICLLTTAFAIMLFWLSGRLWVDLIRVMMFLGTFGVIAAAIVVHAIPFGLFSFWYLLVCYLPFVFVVPVSEEEHEQVLRLFCNLMVPIAGIALMQFMTNLTGRNMPQWLDAAVPERLLLVGYNVTAMTNPDSGLGLVRANAMFFLEPSFVSQFCAVALIVEYLYWKRWLRMGIYAAGIVGSLSGTGAILLAFFAIAWALERKWYALVIPLVITYFMLPFLPVEPNSLFGTYIQRINEFGTPGSSAYIRFVGPFVAVPYLLGDDFANWLFGLGPGAAKIFSAEFAEELAFNPFPVSKMMIEYGILGTVPFLLFISHAFFSRRFSGLLAASCFFMYNLLSGSLQQPHTVFLFLILCVMLVPMDGQRDAA